MSCGQIALKRAKIKVKSYFASEIKSHAMKLTQWHWPKTIQIGDVNKASYKDGILTTENGTFIVGKIDLLIGGSPCQDFSLANKNGQKGLGGTKSKLFYQYLRLRDEINPTFFLLENVKMKAESKDSLDSYLGVDGIYINSNLVSFQNRSRYYWSNIPNIVEPKDKKINFQQHIEKESEKLDYCSPNKTPSRVRMWNNGAGNNTQGSCANITNSQKVYCVTKKQDRCPNSGMIKHKDFARYMSKGELEAAQTVPKGYTNLLSYNQAQDVLGDGWTVDVIAHIFKGLK